MARLAALILIAVAAAGISATGTTAHDSGTVSVNADGTSTTTGGGTPSGSPTCPNCV